MATRIDYLEDPNAPPANSVVPSANVIATDPTGRVLLIRRSDNGNYALPGGGMDVGESMTDTAIRETMEETGWRVEIDGLVGIFTNPNHVLHYTSNDEVRQEFSVVYHGRAMAERPRAPPNGWLAGPAIAGYLSTSPSWLWYPRHGPSGASAGKGQ